MEPFDGAMAPFPLAAGPGVEDELAIEERLEDPDNGVVQKPIAHRSLMDDPALRIADDELLITPMMVCSGRQVIMKVEDIVLQMQGEGLDVDTR